MDMKSFKERAKDVELLLRGKVLSECAITEVSLLRMIIFCNEEREEMNKEILNFKSLIFQQKIIRAEKILQEMKPALYETVKEEFASLHRIREFRNNIAHSMFTWDENEKDISYFYVWEIKVPEDKIQYHQAIKYTLQDAGAMVDEMFRINKKLLGINIIIEDEFIKRFPGFLG